MGNGALAIGPKLPRPSSTLPIRSAGPEFRSAAVSHRTEVCYRFGQRGRRWQ